MSLSTIDLIGGATKTLIIPVPFATDRLTITSLPYPRGLLLPNTFPAPPQSTDMSTVEPFAILPDTTTTTWCGQDTVLSSDGEYMKIGEWALINFRMEASIRGLALPSDIKTLSGVTRTLATISPRSTRQTITKVVSTELPDPTPIVEAPRTTSMSALAGGIVGGLAIFSLLIGLFVRFDLRKKKGERQLRQKGLFDSNDHYVTAKHLSIDGGETGLDRNGIRTNHFELPDTSPVPELDPATGETVVWRANEMP